MKESRPWRKPLSERQALSNHGDPKEAPPSSEAPPRHKLTAWSLGVEEGERRGGEMEADIYMNRSRSSLLEGLPDAELHSSKDKLSLQVRNVLNGHPFLYFDS